MKNILIILSIILVGCQPVERTPEDILSFNGGTITEYTLSDGTRCVIYIGWREGGISCDWRGQ